MAKAVVGKEVKDWVTKCLTHAHWSLPIINAMFQRDTEGVRRALPTLQIGKPCVTGSETCLYIYASLDDIKAGKSPVWKIEMGKVLGKGIAGEVRVVDATDRHGQKRTLVMKRWISEEDVKGFYRELIIGALIQCVNPRAIPKIYMPLVIPEEKTHGLTSAAIMQHMEGTLSSKLASGYFESSSKPERWLTFVVNVWSIFYNLQSVLHFEHRDLHTGNIMFRTTEAKPIRISPCPPATSTAKRGLRHGLDCISEVDIDMPGDGVEYRLIDTGFAVIVLPATGYRFHAGGYYDNITATIGILGDLVYLAMVILWSNRFSSNSFPVVSSSGVPEPPSAPITRDFVYFLMHITDGLWLPWGAEPEKLAWQSRLWYRIVARQEMYPTLRLGSPRYGLTVITRYLDAVKEKKGEVLSSSEAKAIFTFGQVRPKTFPTPDQNTHFTREIMKKIYPEYDTWLAAELKEEKKVAPTKEARAHGHHRPPWSLSSKARPIRSAPSLTARPLASHHPRDRPKYVRSTYCFRPQGRPSYRGQARPTSSSLGVVLRRSQRLIEKEKGYTAKH